MLAIEATCKDFANQIRWSADYATACLPLNWTSLERGAVDKVKFYQQFPEMQSKVEKNEFCQKILRARMADGLLHKAEIHEDVCSYNAATSGAQGCGGGFPCQGVSTAGKQHGLSDPRTKLVHQIFRVFDTLPRDHRRILYFENVKALLGKKRSMRQLFHYIVQARY
ncbi:unnamed protein product [Durusdinium trenchii]|uniref:DNA (cytosine-5-)-methyltransferase n=1 Tax=Durusdinium trenchii TaxID=1381693 RepID=A0ABP0QKF8_9DINO